MPDYQARYTSYEGKGVPNPYTTVLTHTKRFEAPTFLDAVAHAEAIREDGERLLSIHLVLRNSHDLVNAA